MKLRNVLTKFASILLIMVMVFSLVACGDSDEKDDDDSKSDSSNKGTKSELTMSEIVDKAAASEDTIISTEMLDEIAEDKVITYDEFTEILGKFPAMKAEAELKIGAEMAAEVDGEKQEQELSALLNVVVELDLANLELHIGVDGDVNGEKTSFHGWLVNEDGTVYSYEQNGDEEAIRTEIGNFKEAFGEGISYDEFMGELDSEYEDMMAEYEEVYSQISNYADDFENSELVKGIEKFFEVYEKGSLYNIVMNVDASKIIDLVLDSEELTTIFEEAGYDFESLSAILDTEIAEGFVTYQKLIDTINFDINYSIDTKNFLLKSFSFDLKDCANDICDLFVDYMEASGEMGSDDSFSIKVNDAYFTFELDDNAKVDIDFDGEYIDEEDYYDDYYNDAWSY